MVEELILSSAPITSPCDVSWLSALLDDLLCVLDAPGLVGIVDGFHDCRDLPPGAQAGLDRIKALGEKHALQVALDLDDPSDRAAYVAFAPWSIHTTIHDPSCDHDRFYNHDCGYTVLVHLDDDELAALQQRPALASSGATLTPVVPAPRRRRWWRRTP